MAHSVQPTSSIEIDKSETAVLVDSGIVDSPAVWAPRDQPLVSEGRPQRVVEELTSRWNYLESFVWKTSDVVGKELFRAPLFSSIFSLPVVPQNIIPLMPYTYVRADVKLRFEMNASRFQVGMLQTSWIYHAETVEKETSDNIYLCSQRPHVVMQVGTSKSFEIYIPYNSYMDYCTKRGTSVADFALCSTKVLSRLNSSTNGPQSCDITVLFQFTNVRVHGQHVLEDVRAQMMLGRAAVAAAEGALSSIKKDLNRDYPSTVNQQIVVPTASTSWCIGEASTLSQNILRLDPRGLTPHPANNSDEMLTQAIFQTFGLAGITVWKMGIKGALFKSRVGPWMFNEFYPVIKKGNVTGGALDTKAYPPLAVVSSLFSLWRGSIEIRLDVACGPYHTGRLLVAYVPGSSPTRLSIPALMQSYHGIFDVTDKTSFTFTIPYVYGRPWCSVYNFQRDEYGSYSIGTGTVFVWVLNELIPMQDVSQEVNVLIYIRGGADYHLAVPVATQLGLGVDQRYFVSKDTLVIRDPTIYAGAWIGFLNSTAYICRYNDMVGHVNQATSGLFNVVYQSNLPIEISIRTMDENKKVIITKYDCYWFVIPSDPDFVPYKYILPFRSLDRAKAYVMSYDKKTKRNNHRTYAEPYYADGPWGPATATMNFSAVFSIDTAFEIINAQSDEITVAPLETLNIPSSVSFGEDFSDLKTLCRRFQLYTDTVFKLTDTIALGQIFLRVPIYPQGLKLSLNAGERIAEVNNRVRNGLIPLLLSGYRFFKGGIRFKILISAQYPVIIQVAHMPELHETPDLHFPKGNYPLDYMASGYAAYCQSTKVNEVFDLEIPYYLPYCKSLLGVPTTDFLPLSSLGTLCFSILSKTPSPQTLTIQVHYAFADDARAMNFMGFPDLVDRSQVPKIRAQMGIFDTISGISKLDDKVNNLVDRVDASIDHFGDKIEGISDTIQEAATTVSSGCQQTISDVRDLIQRIASTLMSGISSSFESIRDVIVGTISELLHIFVNPTISTICISIGAILVKVGLICTDQLSKFTQWCAQLYNAVMRITPSEEVMQRDEEVRAQSFCIEDITILISSLLGILSSGAKIAMHRKPHESFLRHLANNFGKASKELAVTSNSLLSFFRNNLELVLKCYDWLVGSVFGKDTFTRDLVDCHPAILRWAERSTQLTDPSMKDLVCSDPRLMKEVYVCAQLGRSLGMKINLGRYRDTRAKFICDLTNKLVTLQDDLAKDCLSPATKFEPFVLWLNGPPGCGKSSLLEYIGVDLLKSINFTHFGKPTYVRCPGNTHWNSVKNQPILIFDDFGCTTEALEQQMGELFALKSPSVFNPPIAELENKKTMYNPRVICIAANSAFPKPVTVLDINAFYRRRDVLIHCRLRPHLLQKFNLRDTATFNTLADAYIQYDAEEWKNLVSTYGHMEFAVADDVKDESEPISNWMSYESFTSTLRSRFANYTATETKNYLRRLDHLTDLFPTDDPNLSFDIVAQILDESFDTGIMNPPASNKEFFFREGIKKDRTYDTVVGQMEVEMTPLISREDREAAGPSGIIRKKKIPTRQELKRPSDFPCGHIMYENVSYHYWRPTADHAGYALTEFLNDDAGEYTNQFEDYFKARPEVWLDLTPCQGSCSLKMPYVKDWLAMLWEEVFTMYNFTRDNISEREIPKFLLDEYDLSSYTFSERFDPIPECLRDSTPPGWATRVIANLKSTAYTVWGFLKKYYRWFLGALGAVGVFLVAANQVRSAMRPDYPTTTTTTTTYAPATSTTDPCQPWDPICNQYGTKSDIKSFDSVTGGARRARQHGARMREFASKMAFQNRTQAQSAKEDIEKLISKNLGTISFSSGLHSVVKQHIFAINDKWAITTKHFIEALEFSSSTHMCSIVFGESKITIHVRESDIQLCEHSSIALLRLPRGLRCLRDIRKHIIPFKDIDFVPSGGTVYMCGSGSFTGQRTPISLYYDLSISGEKEYEAQNVGCVYQYQPTGAGLCCAPLVAKVGRDYIIGIHIAGSSRAGYSQPIWRELFDDLDGCALANCAFDPEIFESDSIPLVNFESGGVEQLAVVQPGDTLHLPEFSRIVPSIIQPYKLFPVLTEPTILSSKDERWEHPKSPMYYSVQKHGKNPTFIHPDDLDVCLEDLWRMMQTIGKPLAGDKDILTDDQVICGIPGLYEGMKLSTSEGFPLMLERPRGAHDKRWLIDVTEEDGKRRFLGYHPKLKAILKDRRKNRLEGVANVQIFTDNLKDCRLPLEKVKVAGKTRIFSCSPVDFTIDTKMYFGIFQMAYLSRHTLAEHAIGINCDSGDWTDLANFINGVEGDNFVTGDYSSYGDVVQPDVLEGVLDLICKWYEFHFPDKIQNNKIRRILAYELHKSSRVCLNTFYRPFCGLPSGHAMTVELNSLVNSVYMRYCFLNLVVKPRPTFGMRHFSWKTRIVTYGDDLLLKVSTDFPEFNAISIAEQLQKLDIKFTTSEKISATKPYESFDKITFLKRSFKRHPYRGALYLGPLPEASVTEAINWNWKTENMRDAALEISHACVNAAFCLGPTRYKEIAEKIRLWWAKEHGIQFGYSEWRELDLQKFY